MRKGHALCTKYQQRGATQHPDWLFSMTNISESHRIHLTRDLTPNNHSIDSVSIFDQSEKKNSNPTTQDQVCFPAFFITMAAVAIALLKLFRLSPKTAKRFPALVPSYTIFPAIVYTGYTLSAITTVCTSSHPQHQLHDFFVF